MILSELFRRLVGRWSFRRVTNSKKVVTSCGIAEGTASFAPLDANSRELLYQEEGVFENSIGQELTIRREYVYSYDEYRGIEKYFSDKGQKGGLFYALKFNANQANSASPTDNSSSACATGRHLYAVEILMKLVMISIIWKIVIKCL